MATKQKTFRFSEETEQKLRELVQIYSARSENHALELIIQDIYKLKKSKALIPFEDYQERDMQLQRAMFELGATKKELELLKEEKQKLERELKEKTEKRKGFWARLFGGG